MSACNLPLHILPYNILLLKNNHRYLKKRATAKFLCLTLLVGLLDSLCQGPEDPVKYSPNSGSNHDAHHWPFVSHNNSNG